MEVPSFSTPVSETTAVKALVNNLMPRLGLLTQEAGQLILAQIWVETGRGASMKNHNWGNIAANVNWTGDFWRPPWFDKKTVDAMEAGSKKEQLLRLHQEMLEGKAPQKFRAYPTSLAGLEDYISRLSKEFKAIVEAAKTGNPLTFAQAVKSSRYTPDIIPESFAVTLRSLMKEFERKGLFATLPKAVAGSPELSSLPASPSPSSTAPSMGSDLPVLKVGSEGSAVALWQLFLNYHLIGNGELEVDGMMGEETRKRTAAYQSSQNLLADGIVGPKTWALGILDFFKNRTMPPGPQNSDDDWLP